MRSIALEPQRARARHLSRPAVVALFVAAAAAALPLADLAITGRDPWGQLGRLLYGFLQPDRSAIEATGQAIVLTLAFGFAGVALGAAGGLALAPVYHCWPVRLFSIWVRSIHELFWALLLLQVTGISAATGVVAIALPYLGIFAKVFSEYLDEADRRPSEVLAPRTGALSAFLYARLPLAAAEIRTYTLYRLECGIRSSAVLGFIGLPTLGFQLDTFFKQGQYGAVGAILILYYLVIGTMRGWMRWRLAPVYVAAAFAVLATLQSPPMGPGALWRFLTQDIVPAPLRGGDLLSAETWSRFLDWAGGLLATQALPGLVETLVLAQLALIVTGTVAILGFPLIVPRIVGRLGAGLGHIGLVVGRTSPEYLLAYVFLQILGPSMLPAIIALGLHNGAIIAHLLGRQASQLGKTLRADAPGGLDLYGYELVPRLYGSFLALCLYRWEIIVRESAIVGMLGVLTLGFYIDSAVGELRIDRVMLFLAVTGLATLAIDSLSRALRGSLGVERLSMSG